MGGRWLPEEAKIHISVLEARACRIALETFVPSGARVDLVIDNTTVIGAIRKGRSRNFDINFIANDIFSKWVITSCQYIASEDNPAKTPPTETSRRN